MSSKLKMTGIYILLGIATVISVFPLLWMIIAATNKSVDVIAGKLTIGTNIVENYKNLIAQQPLWSSFWNSCKYTILVTVFALIVSSLAGYAFEIYKSRAKEKIYAIVLMSMMIPFVALMVPLFRMYSKMNLLNSAIGFMLPSLATIADHDVPYQCKGISTGYYRGRTN